jgi:hypothetical protein
LLLRYRLKIRADKRLLPPSWLISIGFRINLRWWKNADKAPSADRGNNTSDTVLNYVAQFSKPKPFV